MLVLDIIQNKIILVPVIAVIISQLSKVLLLMFKHRKIKPEKVMWLAGMPSSHSAFFSALFIVVALKEGVTSSLFAITLLFSAAYIFDLMLVFKILLVGKVEKLEGKLGHSFVEILVGIIIGVLVAFLFT